MPWHLGEGVRRDNQRLHRLARSRRDKGLSCLHRGDCDTRSTCQTRALQGPRFNRSSRIASLDIAVNLHHLPLFCHVNAHCSCLSFPRTLSCCAACFALLLHHLLARLPDCPRPPHRQSFEACEKSRGGAPPALTCRRLLASPCHGDETAEHEHADLHVSPHSSVLFSPLSRESIRLSTSAAVLPPLQSLLGPILPRAPSPFEL
jgi:hypothetical protein